MSTTPTPISGQASAASAPAGTPSTSSSTSNLANENTFLQLLVAQLENQDPENPTDGTQFVTQLAQFTTLQEQTQGTSDLDSILGIMQASQTAASASDPTTGTNTNAPATGSP
jgi:flagellar basal-body rod modification protein FlgD